MARPVEGGAAFAARVREARELALARLLEQKTPDGSWAMPIDLYAFCGAVFVFMLRTTGLIEQAGSLLRESLVVRHMIHQVNPDGGFFKFPGSPSSIIITRIALLALRLVLGEVQPGARPASWYRRNVEIDEEQVRTIRRTISRAERFLAGPRARTGRAFERDHRFLEKILVSHVDPSRFLPPFPLLEPTLASWLSRSGALTTVRRQFHYLLRRASPALSILYGYARARRRLWRRMHCSSPHLEPSRSRRERFIQQLAERIRREQNSSGGWLFNTVYTMLSVMALGEAEIPVNDPSLVRAHGYLLRRLFAAEDGGMFVDVMSNDVWNTSLAVRSYLSNPGRSAMDEEIRPSIEMLLQEQRSDGAYAWGSGSENDAENDSTAVTLRTLALAARTAEGDLGRRIADALCRSRAFLLSRQNKRGGFGVWDNTFVRCKPGSFGLVSQALFDVATADVTGRVVQSLAAVGLTTEHEQVRKALRFFIRNQCRNGAWWYRWWAGYIVGTDSVLRACGSIGFRYAPDFKTSDGLLARSHQAMMKAIRFLLQHQNAGGGWGETTRSDTDIRYAGRGDSTPLQTAYTLSALLACGYPAGHDSVRRGIEYLLSPMTPDGRWKDRQATFTLLAGTCYYRYAFLNYILPLDALTDYLRAMHDSGADPRQAESPVPAARARD